MPRLLLLALSIIALHTLPLHAAITFTDQAAGAGVADPGEANGASFGDYDGDGWPDLLVTRLDDGERVLLYRNQGDGTFADRSALLPSGEQTMGAAFVDHDSDGDLDIFLIHFRRPNQLLRNDGGTFTAISWPETAGANLEGTSAVFGDFDADGTLDLFATHRRGWSNQYYTRFYRDGFANQSLLVSLLRSGQDSFGAVPFDYDNDGDLDLYVTNLNHPNLLHRNDGRGLFAPAAEELRIHRAGPSIGAFPADYDNDGDLDLYVINVGNQANVLYRNDSPEPFADMTAAAGVGQSKNTTGAAWADFDSDGDLDLILSNTDGPTVYENHGNAAFADITSSAIGDGTLAPELYTAGVAAADYDNDGDVDIFLARVHGPDILLRNDSPAAGHYLRVELRGRDNRQSALGARVTVETAAATQIREYVVASILGSLHGDLLHFGLGAAETVEALTVEWPSGQRQTLRNVSADQVLRIDQPRLAHDLRLRVLAPDLAPGWGALTPEIEIENVGSQQVDDAALEARISQNGESVYSRAVSVPDLAPGESVRLRLDTWSPQAGGQYRFSFALTDPDDQPRDNRWERVHYLHPFADVAPDLGLNDDDKGWAGAFADYDGDGDLDIYLSGGGVYGRGTNRLYRNDGNRGFSDATRTSGVADEGNGTGITFADFDNDGHLDLFVAKGGFDPDGQTSRFFRNSGDGTFADITSTTGLDAPQSSYGAVVGDYDSDGYPDLYIPRLRGQPNGLYHNAGNNTFTDVTLAGNIQSFLRYSGSTGAFADYDNDGDLDLYASIFGTYDVFYTNSGGTSFFAQPVGSQGSTTAMAAGDYDSDGDLDLYVVNVDGRSALYRNEVERGLLVDVGAESGTENFSAGTGCAFGDLDNDGDLDLFVTNRGRENRVYANQGNGSFADLAASFGMADAADSRGVMLGDYDSDGDLDAYVINEAAPDRLYRNGGNANHYLDVRARGTQSNRDAHGTRLQVFANGRILTREVNGTSGFSLSSRVAHFGLAEVERIDSLKVRWPRGQVEVYRDLPANSALLLIEGESITAVAEDAVDSQPPEFDLAPNYPNPFNASTAIRFTIVRPGRVRLILYDALGQRVRQLVDEHREAGAHQVLWNGRDDRDQPVASGAYFYRLQAGEREQVRSMLLLR